MALAGVFMLILTFGPRNTAYANTPNPITGTVNTSDPERMQCSSASGSGMMLRLFGRSTRAVCIGLPISYGENDLPHAQHRPLSH